MTTALVIRSNRDGDALSIVADSRDYWRAIVECGDLTTVLRFYEPELASLRGYFAEMAEAWRGWEGEKGWGSLEGEVHLAAVHDRLGTVSIVARLRSGPWEFRNPRWLVEVQLLRDAGTLDTLTQDAARLVAA